jgi:hypothetical protein
VAYEKGENLPGFLTKSDVKCCLNIPVFEQILLGLLNIIFFFIFLGNFTSEVFKILYLLA